MEFCPQKLFLFDTSFTLEPKKLLLTKSTVAQIVMVNGKYEIRECLLSHLEGCLFYDKDAADFSKVFITIGKQYVWGFKRVCFYDTSEFPIRK